MNLGLKLILFIRAERASLDGEVQSIPTGEGMKYRVSSCEALALVKVRKIKREKRYFFMSLFSMRRPKATRGKKLYIKRRESFD